MCKFEHAGVKWSHWNWDHIFCAFYFVSKGTWLVAIQCLYRIQVPVLEAFWHGLTRFDTLWHTLTHFYTFWHSLTSACQTVSNRVKPCQTKHGTPLGRVKACQTVSLVEEPFGSEVVTGGRPIGLMESWLHSLYPVLHVRNTIWLHGLPRTCMPQGFEQRKTCRERPGIKYIYIYM